MKIESLQNEKVKNWVKLQEKKYRDTTKLFLVESEHLVSEALKYQVIKELIVLEGFEQDYPEANYIVSEKIMKKISTQVTVPHVCAVCSKLEEKEIIGDVLVLDDLSDPGNLGTILRSAVAFNISNIVLSLNSVDLYNPKVIRSCEGMFFSLNIVRRDLPVFLEQLSKSHAIYGTDVTSGTLVKQEPKPLAIIIGSEGKGMNPLLRKYCDGFYYIPMENACESLNAGVSASILMYEIYKQKNNF